VTFFSYRKKIGLTQEEVAKELKIGRSAISKWETGVTVPRAELLPRIATLYNCTIEQLLGVSKEESSNQAS